MHSPVQNIASVPLGVASQNGHIRVVEKLLEGGAHINYRDRVGYHWCIYLKYA